MAAIEFDPENLDKMLSNMILQSTLGNHLRALTEKHLTKLNQSYDNPIEKILQEEVNTVVRKLVQDEFRPKIEEIVRSKMTDEVVQECATAAWTQLTNAIARNRY